MSAHPLAIYGALLPGDMDAIKAAKVALNPPFQCLPVPAAPGGPSRVLVLRERVPFPCDHYWVAGTEDAAELQRALWWVLDETRVDPKAVLVDDMLLPLLQSALGPGVRELEPEREAFSWDEA